MLQTLLTAVLLAPAPALACGGFFCNNSTPIDQSAERIVFDVDKAAGTVDTHVQIFYTGSAEEFAWVLPTPNQPELFLSTDTLFNELAWRMDPQFRMDWHEEGDCSSGGGWYSSEADLAASASSSWADTGAAGGGVVVVDEKRVGPYETVTLKADDEAALLDWLQEAGYDLPDTLDDALAPYVSFGAYFVALKLAKDEDVGDIAPLGMTYAGTRPMIPITLTSVAATPDMRLETYVFGDFRAVPDNYLHVQINEVAIDWFSGGANYESAITLAADEAGGQAFATDYAGSPDFMADVLYTEGRYDTAYLATLEDPVAFMDGVMSQGFPADNALLEVLSDVMPPPDGVDATDFYNCVSCYADEIDYVFDPIAAADAIEERLVEPLRRADALFDNRWVTRMTSSISPVEMTIDPMFVFNPDMGEVALEHRSDLYIMCGAFGNWYNSQRRLELSDGRYILIPSEQWFVENGVSYQDFFEGLTNHYAKIIEDTHESGEPTVLFNLLEQGDATLDDWNASQEGPEGPEGSDPKGCGCNSADAGAVGWVVALGLLGLRRRR